MTKLPSAVDRPAPKSRLPYHLRCATLRDARLPMTVPELIADVPDRSAVVVDLCDMSPMTEAAASELRRALDEAWSRGVVAVLAANDADVRQQLIRAAIHHRSPVCHHVHTAQRQLQRRLDDLDLTLLE